MEDSKQKILDSALRQFALSGADGFSMRRLADEVGITQSVIYYYFSSKDELLKVMFDTTNTQLGVLRAQLPHAKNVQRMLEQRVVFQFDHAQEVVAVLKYYLFFRSQFKKVQTGFVPLKAYLHIEEVLARGIDDGVFDPMMDVASEAKVITHAINGFLLEYYPHTPQGGEKREMVTKITQFLWRAIPKAQTV